MYMVLAVLSEATSLLFLDEARRRRSCSLNTYEFTVGWKVSLLKFVLWLIVCISSVFFFFS